MAGLALLMLSLVAAVAIFFELRTEGGAQREEARGEDRELTASR